MPNLIGLSRATATSLVSQRGLVLDVVDTSTTETRPDTVVLQDPPQNRLVRAGDRVRFTVGAQQKVVAVPIDTPIVSTIVAVIREHPRAEASVRVQPPFPAPDGDDERRVARQSA